MQYLISAIVFTTIFAQFYKFANKHRLDGLSVNAGAYLSAVIVLSLYLHIIDSPAFEAELVQIGICGGIATFITVFTFFYVVKLGKLGISWAIINLSFLFTVFVSAIWWHEHITIQKAIGLGLGVIAVVCLGKEQAAKEKQ